jgi:hypothetical protein
MCRVRESRHSAFTGSEVAQQRRRELSPGCLAALAAKRPSAMRATVAALGMSVAGAFDVVIHRHVDMVHVAEEGPGEAAARMCVPCWGQRRPVLPDLGNAGGESAQERTRHRHRGDEDHRIEEPLEQQVGEPLFHTWSIQADGGMRNRVCP